MSSLQNQAQPQPASSRKKREISSIEGDNIDNVINADTVNNVDTVNNFDNINNVDNDDEQVKFL